jgi:hypothetical protein
MSGTTYNIPRLFRAVVYPRNTAIVREPNSDLCRVVWVYREDLDRIGGGK